MENPDSKDVIPPTKTTSPVNGGPIIEESQESEEYQQDLQVVLGTAFGVLAVVGLIALALLLYRLYRIRSGNLSSYNQNDDLNLFERDISLDVTDKSDVYSRQPTVLMLYAQDCPIHERMVAALASFLMEACGCVVSLDLLEEAELAQQGLDDWLVERLQEADYILTVCSLGARLRCSKKHLRFKKWTSLISGHTGRHGAGDESVSSSPMLKKLKELDVKGDNKHQGSRGVNSGGDNVLTSLSGDIADYFAVAVDYVAEKMRVEQQKGLGLRKFINVYFDYSARSDIPPQLEMAAQYCLMRDLKQLRLHLLGATRSTAFQNQTNEREESITIERVGDGSDKSEESEGPSGSLSCQPCSILETETGMLLRATLEQAKAFFNENPSWMEETLERACPQLSHPTHSAGLSKRGRDKRWRKKRRHRYAGHRESQEIVDESVKEPLLGGPGCRQVGSSLVSAPAQQRKSREVQGDCTGCWSREEIHVHTDSRHREHVTRVLRNTLPRLGKTVANTVNSGDLKGWGSSDMGQDSPVPHSVFLSRQNSLPSSLASCRTPDLPDSTPSAAPSPSYLQPAAKLSAVSKSADSFAVSRDLREWHPMDQERQPCLYCNSTQLDKGCVRCRPAHLGNPKAIPDCDIEPGFSSSAEGIPALVPPSSKSQTVLQAEVHQEWRPGTFSATDLEVNQNVCNSGFGLTKGNVSTKRMVQAGDKHSLSFALPRTQTDWSRQVEQIHLNSGVQREKVKGDSTGMKRWVSGIVPSPNHWVLAEDDRNFSNSLKQPASLAYHRQRRLSGASSLSSHEDSASIVSSDSMSDGDSLERDLRSIEKISSFHDFVVSSSFVDSHGISSLCCESFQPSLLPPPSTLQPFSHQPEHV